MGVNDDANALLRDLGATRDALRYATRASLDDIGGTLRDLVRRADAEALAGEIRDLLHEHASAVAVLRALDEGADSRGDADGSVLDARVDAALAAGAGALRRALDRIDS